MDRNQATSGTLLGLFVGSGCSALIYEVASRRRPVVLVTGAGNE